MFSCELKQDEIEPSFQSFREDPLIHVITNEFSDMQKAINDQNLELVIKHHNSLKEHFIQLDVKYNG